MISPYQHTYIINCDELFQTLQRFYVTIFDDLEHFTAIEATFHTAILISLH